MKPLYRRNWACECPRGLFVMVHGLGEFCDRYAWVADRLVDEGYAVLAFDLPGHGRTPGRRGHVDRFDAFLDALADVLSGAAETYPGVPIVLFGHSMGGLVIARFLQTRRLPADVRAIVLSSPCFDIARPVTPTQRRLVQIFSTVWPTWLQSTGIAPESVSRTPEIQRGYRLDEFVLRRVSMRFLDEFFRAMDAVRSTDLPPVPCPILIAQAGADRVVSVAATRQFADRLQAPAKQLVVYPDSYHEILNDPNRDEVLADILAWLREQARVQNP
ncbi:MAG: lysophospholipase [Alicyclobacillus sp.]|nr:lysophospholipase [Alicyclobacillus sp.]